MSVKRGISSIGMLALIVAGCSSTGAVDGPVLTSPAELFGPSGGMTAEVTGVLVYDKPANCLLMELEDVQYPLVWPAGSKWQEDPPAVVLGNGEKVEPGMTVYGGGGYLQREHVEEMTGPAVAAAADRCTGPTGEIAFFNPESEVEVVDSSSRSTDPITNTSGSRAERHSCARSVNARHISPYAKRRSLLVQ